MIGCSAVPPAAGSVQSKGTIYPDGDDSRHMLPITAGTLLPGTSSHIWVVVKIMAPFGVPIIIRLLLFRGTQKGTLILTTTQFGEKDSQGLPRPEKLTTIASGPRAERDRWCSVP